MRVNVSKITESLNKVTALVTGDKQIPGVLLVRTDDKLSIRYHDGHKALINDIEATFDETDSVLDAGVVVDYDQLKRIVNSAQPDGNIIVDALLVEFKDKVAIVTVNKFINTYDEEGNILDTRQVSSNRMDILWMAPNANIKTSLLTRFDYDSVFSPDSAEDIYDKDEFISALNKTSVEKGKNIYFSKKTQTVFVANQAHLTSVPISKANKLTQEELDEVRADLTEKGVFTEENYREAIEVLENRIHYMFVMNQAVAKSVIGILSKTSAEDVYVHTRDKFCNIYIDSDEEKVGIWFEMAVASKAQVGALERYNSLAFKTYQITFLREVLANSIKIALASTKNDNVEFSFNKNEVGETNLVVHGGSAQASTNDLYAILCDDVIEPDGALNGKKFSVALKVFAGMLEQLSTTYVALDFDIAADGTVYIRLSELNHSRLTDEYYKARQETERLCGEQGIQFDASSTPTPIQLKLDYRDRCLDTKQFTIIKK